MYIFFLLNGKGAVFTCSCLLKRRDYRWLASSNAMCFKIISCSKHGSCHILALCHETFSWPMDSVLCNEWRDKTDPYRIILSTQNTRRAHVSQYKNDPAHWINLILTLFNADCSVALAIQSRGVGIAQSLKRPATGWTARVTSPAVQDFSLLHSVQIDSGAYPVSYPVSTGVSFPGVKRKGREADYSPPLPRSRKVELYSPIGVNGIVRN
jgi:hypothetical protein